MRTSLLLALLFATSAAFAPGAARAQTVTAIARVVAPQDSKCPQVDRTKTVQFTGQGCTDKACNSARQTAIAQLKGDVDSACDNFVRADPTCVKNGC
jgi:hypothetical protein